MQFSNPLKGPKIDRCNAHLIANNIAFKLFAEGKTLDDFLMNFEHYMENEINLVCKDCSIENEESREIGRLITYIYSEKRDILEIFSDFERESRHLLQQKKEQGILHSKYPTNLTDRRIYLTKMLPSMMIKQINEGTLYDVAPSEDSHGDLDENTPMLNIAQDTLDKFLPSF